MKMKEDLYLRDRGPPLAAMTLWLLFPLHIEIDPGCSLWRRGVGRVGFFLGRGSRRRRDKKEGESTTSYFLSGGAVSPRNLPCSPEDGTIWSSAQTMD